MSSATHNTTRKAAAGGQIELVIGGMTCASCAARVEKRLNKLDGVNATVNYATEKAKVTYPEGNSPSILDMQWENFAVCLGARNFGLSVAFPNNGAKLGKGIHARFCLELP